MQKYKYRAITDTGKPTRGVLGAANEQDLFSQLQDSGLELIDCKPINQGKNKFSLSFRKKVKIRDLIQFFVHLEQMQGAGISILDCLADMRDTADNEAFRDVISEMYRDVSEGSTLSESMANHPKVFGNLHVSLIAAGEENGNIRGSCLRLIEYLKWQDQMQSKVRKATRYPLILLIAVLFTITIMMAFVVPQIVDFIKNIEMELPWPTVSLMVVSDFFVEFWYYVIGGPIVFGIAVYALTYFSEGFAYRVDAVLLKLPIMGELLRKINISRFANTFSSLYLGGIDVLKALNVSSNTVDNKVLAQSLSKVSDYVKEGEPLSQALNISGEFPSMVVRMVRVGEESGNLSNVLDQVSEFYTNDVDEEVQKIIAMIEPLLTAILGVIILWIAVGVFGPVYSSFENIDF
jgi:type IV pilus assembly protein PilC